MHILDVTPEIRTRTEELQSELHDFVNMMKEKSTRPNLKYEDLVIVFFLTKIADLESRINEQGTQIDNDFRDADEN